MKESDIPIESNIEEVPSFEYEDEPLLNNESSESLDTYDE